MQWCPLTVHSQYSILNSTIALPSLIDKSVEMGYTSVGLTDNGNLYAAVDFQKLAKKAGIKPIIGSKFNVSHDQHTNKSRVVGLPNASSLFLLAKDATGYKNLSILSSKAFLDGFYYVPRIDLDLLERYKEGLVCLCGTLGSLLSFAQLERPDLLDPYFTTLQRLFPDDLFLQIENYEMLPEQIENDGIEKESWLFDRYQNEQELRKTLKKHWIDLSRQSGVPLLATHEPYYLEPHQWRAHEVLMNVQSGETLDTWHPSSSGDGTGFKQKNPKRDVCPSHEHYFKSPEQMARAFADVPQALENAQQIAQRCEFYFDYDSKHYPSFAVPKDFIPANIEATPTDLSGQFLAQATKKLISKRYSAMELEAIAKVYPGQDPATVIEQRLESELDVILSKGLADYLLIVADFITWAKDQKIPVGPGRGSGAGSIICYLLGITDIEPLRFHLFFERFINPERASYPDIDVDICMERRAEVIDYMLQKYGRDNVAQIITFGTMKAKMSIKDVGRVLNVPLAKVNALAKLFPDDLNLTLAQALEEKDVRELYDSDPQTTELFNMAIILEGCVRNTGIHAAGLIICAEPLQQHIPLCVSKDAAMPVTQFSMKPAESIGMLKIDFLGLKTLTSIQYCIDSLGDLATFDWMNLPLDDANTFALLNQGKTLGVFQLESSGMQDLARNLHLDKFEEIIAIVSLYRPGPMDMIPSFIARKLGREEIENDHPWLEEILSETYGIMVYQEQVMQIASKMADFSLAQGDVLRRAMGKKDAAEMAQQRLLFVEGAQAKGVSEPVATKVFNKMEKFAAYGFNKSHAAAYGYIAYVTGFLKANFPSQWLAALMTCDRDDIAKVSKFIAEAKSMGIAILPPDVNSSGEYFTPTNEGIRFSLGAIKGVGRGISQEIVLERNRGGPFKDFYDFVQRLYEKKMSKKVVECLIDAGGFDFTTWSRDALVLSIEPVFSRVAQKNSEDSKGFMNLFDALSVNEQSEFSSAPQVPSPRSSAQIYLREKELLGFFLTGNPLESYNSEIINTHCNSLDAIDAIDGEGVLRLAFIIDEIAVKTSQRTGKKFAILKISDGTFRFELPVWPEMYDENAHNLKENSIFLAVVSVENKTGLKLSCRWLQPIDEYSTSTSQKCDEAFDKAKEMQSWQKRERKPKKEQTENERTTEENVTLQLAQCKLTHILSIAQCIKNNPGGDVLKLDIVDQQKVKHRLHTRVRLGSKDVNKMLDDLNSGKIYR